MSLPDFPFRLSSFPREMNFVRELEACDGPILSEFRASDSGRALYLEKWCAHDRADGITRWMIVRSDPRAIAEYLACRISMKNLLVGPSDGIGWIVDRKRNSELVSVFLVSLADLPSMYLPKEEAFHDVTLRPEWDHVPQSFLIDSDWNMEAIATRERRFHEVTAFGYLTDTAATDRRLPAGILQYEMDRGYPMRTALSRMIASMPREQRAKREAVMASSPGVFTLNVPSQVAGRLEAALKILPKTSNMAGVLYSWARISPKKIEKMPDLSLAIQHLKTVCGYLNVNLATILPEQNADDATAVLVAGKLLMGYYRRLWEVLSSDGIDFVSVDVESAEERPEVGSADEDDEVI